MFSLFQESSQNIDMILWFYINSGHHASSHIGCITFDDTFGWKYVQVFRKGISKAFLGKKIEHLIVEASIEDSGKIQIIQNVPISFRADFFLRLSFTRPKDVWRPSLLHVCTDSFTGLKSRVCCLYCYRWCLMHDTTVSWRLQAVHSAADIHFNLGRVTRTQDLQMLPYHCHWPILFFGCPKEAEHLELICRLITYSKKTCFDLTFLIEGWSSFYSLTSRKSIHRHITHYYANLYSISHWLSPLTSITSLSTACFRLNLLWGWWSITWGK